MPSTGGRITLQTRLNQVNRLSLNLHQLRGAGWCSFSREDVLGVLKQLGQTYSLLGSVW